MSTLYLRSLLLLLVVFSLTAGTAAGQLFPPRPAPDPGGPPNVWYGAVPPGANVAPVLVFIHGLRGRADDWWLNNNDMYDIAYRAGYRTAFVSLSADNSRNDSPIQDNADVLKQLLPGIATRFGATKMYFVGHSKGGLDLQLAMAQDPVIGKLAKAVFTLSTPNTGTELADWAFGPGFDIADALGLTTPGVEALQTAAIGSMRAQIDPILDALNVPFYTMAGTTWSGNILTVATGVILRGLVDAPNDGLVPLTRTALPVSYASEMGKVAEHHFQTDSGSVAFPKIQAHIHGIELSNAAFQRIAKNGFGDGSNSWMWSMAWFKGKLYVGTGRELQCTSFAAAAVHLGVNVYPVPGNDCPVPMTDLRLQAEIWQYTPETKTWRRVFQSPANVPVEVEGVTSMVARDSGFRGMMVFREKSGVEALYVAGVTASSLFDGFPPHVQAGAFPPPRILRSVDGETFAPIPQDPGTFMGDIALNSPDQFKVRGFRSFAIYKDKLYVTASDFRGIGVILEAEDPQLGNDAWRIISPPAQQLPVWTLKVFNGYLYCATGDRNTNVGYGVYKTDATGSPPYTFTSIVPFAGGQTEDVVKALNALSLEEFKGHLYVGSDRQTEMIRIAPDDSWDLIVGYPRWVNGQFKAPLSGIGQWFGNFFSGHFWRMINWNGQLRMGTWDWSLGAREIQVLDALFRPQYGADLYRTEDGIHWSFDTRQGFGNPLLYGIRTFQPTPFGLFVGGANPINGGEVFVNQEPLDLDRDGDIDRNDVNLITGAIAAARRGQPFPAAAGLNLDLNGDGRVDLLDARMLTTQCTEPGCAVVTPAFTKLPPPKNLDAASAYAVGRQVRLVWQPTPGAVKYRVYRAEIRPLLDLLPPNLEIPIPGTDIPIRVPEDFVEGTFDAFCAAPENEQNLLCLFNNIFQTVDMSSDFLGLPLFWVPIAETATTGYSEQPPTPLQSLYFVQAVDASGRASDASNMVGAPSLHLPIGVPPPSNPLGDF